MHSYCRKDTAASDSFGTILMVAVTILLALVVLLLINVQFLAWSMEKAIPEIFIITTVESRDEITGHLNFDSRVILLHTGGANYQNNNLKAKFFRNGYPLSSSIVTMNGYDFISTHHYGVQWMGGSGCSGATWNPGERICLDFTDGTFHHGDTIRVDIVDKKLDVIISRHEFLYT